MDITQEIQEKIIHVVLAKFEEGVVEDISIESIEVDEIAAQIHIKLIIKTSADASKLADGYFGMTGSVRKALGSNWSNFFPVITPRIGCGVHA